MTPAWQRLVLIATAIIVAIGSFAAFQQFQQRWLRVRAFNAITKAGPLEIRHLFASPQALNVAAWQDGDAATYESKSGHKTRRVSYSVIKTDQTLLAMIGRIDLNGVNAALVRAVSESDIRMGAEKKSWLAFDDRTVSPFAAQAPLNLQLVYERIGSEVLACGELQLPTDRFHVSAISASGDRTPFMRLWVNSKIRPLGIARAEWRDESIQLVSWGVNDTNTRPDRSLRSLPWNQFTGNNICASCHGTRPFGAFTVHGPNISSARSLDLTTAFYHARAAGVVDADPMYVARSTQSGDFVQFKTGHGSLRARIAPPDSFSFSFDPIMTRAHVVITSATGPITVSARPQDSNL